jgi:tryptophan synthase alpha chain
MPIILMGYINPVYQFGYNNFIKKLIECGIDGVILPDLPLDDYLVSFKEEFDKNNLSYISLVSPNTSVNRIRQASPIPSLWLY